jgi:phytoene dehydrogenase-like protein
VADPDALVIGSGPNGLAAAIVIARTGRKVIVYEASETIGGGARSAELTLPGFTHDVGSAVHPSAVISPLFRTLPLAEHGLQWIEPPAAMAHPFDDGTAAICERSIEATAARFDAADADTYTRVMGGLARDWPRLEWLVLGPAGIPRHPVAATRFGLKAMQSAAGFARRTYASEHVRGLFAGIAAHGMVPLERMPTAAFGLVLGTFAHVTNWPFPRGGAQRLTNALVSYLRSLGGEVITNHRVESLNDLPPARAVLCDLSPKPLLKIAGDRFPPAYRRQLEHYRYGMAAFKVDWALDAPIPWRAPECARAATVHIGGTLDQIACSEREVWAGRVSDRPYVLLVQPTLFDASRAPAGKHTVWTYCHVPNGSTVDMLPRIEQQIERCAPGFRDRVLARQVTTPADFERANANLVGGDIASGASTLWQLFARPTWRMYETPARGVYICSAATPPGVGVHGMCGYFAAQLALEQVLRD